MDQDKSEGLSRRRFIQRFGVGAAAVPLVFASGCFSGPIGWPNGGDPPTGS
jgi:hypothetical protein